jgi:hypothetical protein
MSPRHPCIPGAPLGPVAARIRRRTSAGRISAISCATKPPIEKPSRSTLSSPSASAKVIIFLAVSAMHGPNAPVEAPIPG